MNGSIFGGDVLDWMEGSARHCAGHFCRSTHMITISMSRIFFHIPIYPTDLVECTARVVYTTRHTVHVRTSVSILRGPDNAEMVKSHDGYFVVANTGPSGIKQPLHTGLDLAADDVGALQEYAVSQAWQRNFRAHENTMLLKQP
jgi:acyl-CoA hydrolase